jgi:uncharacterized membrane protein (DUF373 family)
MNTKQDQPRILWGVRKFEQVIVIVLLGLLMLTVASKTLDMARILIKDAISPPKFQLTDLELFEIFGLFFMVLLGLELLETIKTYLDDEILRVEVVFLVALVAIARKIVILDYATITPEMLFGIAALIIALSAGYYLVKRAFSNKRS